MELFPERDCATCDADKRKEYGCSGGAVIPQMILGELSDVCPRRPLLDDPETFSYLLNAHAHYDNGYLMHEGCVLDQPYKLMNLVAIVANQVVDCRHEKQQLERSRLGAASTPSTTVRPGGKSS